ACGARRYPWGNRGARCCEPDRARARVRVPVSRRPHGVRPGARCVSAGSASFAGPSPLTEAEVRVLGCLLEKQRTTPDVYPLSLNSLRLACNQSTNRDPVVQYDEATIRDAIARLER